MTIKPKSVLLVGMYLAAIVAANLFANYAGERGHPEWTVYSAFVLIGLDLTARDLLHDFWVENRLAKLGALIVAGSALAYAINPASQKVAVASAVAFAASAVADTGIYYLLHKADWFQRVNGSNVVSAAVDSIVFPTMAFGGILWSVSFGQFTAKVAGGALWALVLARVRKRRFDRGPMEVAA